MAQLIIFELKKVDKPFSMDINYDMNDIKEVDWSIRNNLSAKLNQQAINNRMNFQLLSTACNHILDWNEDRGNAPPIKEIVTVVDGQKEKMLHYGLNIDDSRLINACYLYDKISFSKAQNDVLSRDHDILNHIDDFKAVYAIVLLNNYSEYIGHIYSWVSPDMKTLFSIGIRSRPDMVFLRSIDMGMKNVSYYLIEGVRQLANKLGVDSIIIPKALRNMYMILTTKMNFSPEKVDVSMLKFPSSLYNPYDKTTNILIRRDLKKPITSEPISVTMILQSDRK